MAKVIKSGAKNQEPGLYREASAQGAPVVNGRVVTLREGCELPPTHHGSGWVRAEEEQ